MVAQLVFNSKELGIKNTDFWENEYENRINE